MHQINNFVFNKFAILKLRIYEIKQLIIPDFLFAEPKKFILVKIPHCVSNENTVKRFLGILQSFVHHKFDIAVYKWSTKKITSLFPLKDKKPHTACEIYEVSVPVQ